MNLQDFGLPGYKPMGPYIMLFSRVVRQDTSIIHKLVYCINTRIYYLTKQKLQKDSLRFKNYCTRTRHPSQGYHWKPPKSIKNFNSIQNISSENIKLHINIYAGLPAIYQIVGQY